jgi:DNA-binding PadR family transcriptional regulator
MRFEGMTAPCPPWWAWAMAEKKSGRGERHRHRERSERGPGFSPGGPGFGPRGTGGPPFGGPPFGGGRGRRRRGDVRIALLMLLEEEPRNGYQLMQTIEERSGGRWRPSPGSVYPALSQLEDEGFVQTIAQDSGRAFEITDAGREYLKDRDDASPPWETPDGPGAQTFHELRSLVFGLGKAAFQVVQEGNPEQWAQAIDVLDEARPPGRRPRARNVCGR